LISQFDICPVRGENGSPRRRRLVVILQHEIARRLETCVVAPLVPEAQLPVLDRLRPVIAFDGKRHVLAVDRLAAIERRTIGAAIGSAAAQRDRLVAALDFLFTGF
jgi:toxin CcdB